VWIGATDGIWDIIRQFRKDVIIWVFDPDSRVIDELRDTHGHHTSPRSGGAVLSGLERTGFFSQLADLRMEVAEHSRVNWGLEIAGDPRLHQEWGPLVVQTVQQARQFRYSMELTKRTNVDEWTRVALEMLPQVVGSPPLNLIPRCLDGIPAVIVGAGPSLEGNIRQLAAIQDRVAIIATNSSIGPLERHGIQPDIVCVVETQAASIEAVVNSPLWPGAVLVYGSHVWPGIVQTRARHKIPALQGVGPIGGWLCHHLHIPPILTGGSVSTISLRVAELLGASAAILVGMDCAEGPDGRALYARGVSHAHIRESCPIGYPQWPVTAWGGIGQVLTSPQLDSYRQWFEGVSKSLSLKMALINATEGGARIERWEEVPLRRVRVGERVDVASRIDAAIEQTPTIGVRRVIDGLRGQMEGSREFAVKTRILASQVAAVSRTLGQMPRYGARAIIANEYSPAPLEDLGMMPRMIQLTALERAASRVVDRRSSLEQMLQMAITRLETEHGSDD